MVKGPHAFLQSKKGLIDLRSFCLPVLVIAHAVLGSLATGQVHEQQLAAVVHALLLNFDLGDRVTPARRVIGLRRVCRTHLVSLLNQIEDLVIVVNELLFESRDLNSI